MKNKILLLFVLSSLYQFAIAQENTKMSAINVSYKNESCRASFEKRKLDGENNPETLTKVALQIITKDERAGVKLNYRNESPGGFHYSFTQTFQNLPVYQSELKINTNKQQTITSVLDNSFDTKSWSTININSFDIENNTLLKNFIKDKVKGKPAFTSTPVVCYDYDDYAPKFAYQVTINQVPAGPTYEVLLAQDKILYFQDLNNYFSQDSTVSGYVYNPDPLTTAHVLYGAPYIDNGHACATVLNIEEQPHSFKANFDGTTFHLSSPYVAVIDFDSPQVAPVVSSTPVFNYTRCQSGFQDVNAFYHISTIQQYIHNLGFHSADGFVNIDTHGMMGADNSFFSSSNNPRTVDYGTGGVPDAEDADVVVHEYNHSVSYTAAPHSNSGFERNALDEGYADYMAASYSKSIDPFHWDWVYNWDGHNQYWSGRTVVTSNVYPANLGASIYIGGTMWASTMMQILADIGRAATDSLILQTHYAYAQNITMAQAAQLFIDADTLLNNGRYFCHIYPYLHARGFITLNTNCTNSIEDLESSSWKFMGQPQSFTIYNFSNLHEATVLVYDLLGNQISIHNMNGQIAFTYTNNLLASGTYLVQVRTANFSKTFKWINLQ